MVVKLTSGASRGVLGMVLAAAAAMGAGLEPGSPQPGPAARGLSRGMGRPLAPHRPTRRRGRPGCTGPENRGYVLRGIRP